MEPLFKIKIFWPTARFFTKIFLNPTPNHFGRLGTCHDITKSAGSQANNLQTMIAWLQNSANKQLQNEDLRKQESIEKISNWMKTDISSQSPFRKESFGNSS